MNVAPFANTVSLGANANVSLPSQYVTPKFTIPPNSINVGSVFEIQAATDDILGTQLGITLQIRCGGNGNIQDPVIWSQSLATPGYGGPLYAQWLITFQANGQSANVVCAPVFIIPTWPAYGYHTLPVSSFTTNAANTQANVFIGMSCTKTSLSSQNLVWHTAVVSQAA